MASRWNRISLASLLLAFAGAVALGQSSSIGIDQAYAGDRNVTGQGVAGSAPLTVYELAGTRRNYLGKSDSVDQHGFYAVAVNPPLTNGQRIVVVDSQGRSSGVATVVVKTGPAGPSD